ncbi:MAG TPA: rhomboid family intramembrane serine protease, partial [Anaerolineae bacterium]
ILGSFTYLVFYLVCGVVAGIVQALVVGPSDVPSIGASGAIAGVLGAYLLLYPFAKVTILLPIFLLFWGIDLPALIVIGWWFVQQLFSGLGALSSAAASGIAFWAHIGGFVMGALLILPYLRRARPRRRVVPLYDAADDLVFPGS